MTFRIRYPRRLRGILALVMCFTLTGAALVEAQAPADSLSPVFRSDSAQTGTIRQVEAGATTDTAKTLARADSLQAKLKRRGPYVGLSAGVSFAEHSAGNRFAAAMNAAVAADSQRILQRQDPVHVYFPAGLLVGVPVLPHFDLLLRTEHYHYRVTGLAQKDNDPPTEFWYVNQGHLAGAGVKWLVPGSLLTVTGQPGLYAAYTHFWSFGPTGMRSPEGSVRARTAPGGAGFEIQAGFQQDFDKRWVLTGGLSFSRLAFGSAGDWSNVVAGSAPGQADWTLTSMRFALQGLYQFGRTRN
jgi:hypothetical protein